MKKLKRILIVLSSISIFAISHSCLPSYIPLYRGKIEPVLDYLSWVPIIYQGHYSYYEVVELPNCTDSIKLKFYSRQEFITLLNHPDTTKIRFLTIEQVCNRFPNTSKFLIDSKIYHFNQSILKRDNINLWNELGKYENSRREASIDVSPSRK